MNISYLLWFALMGITVGANTAYADCGDGTSDEDVKNCLSQELRDSDARINAVYKALMNSKNDSEKKTLRDSQRAWLKNRDKKCGLDNKESDREKWLEAILADQLKTVCVVRYTFERVSELNAMLTKMDIAPKDLPAAPQAPQFAPSPAPTTPNAEVPALEKFRVVDEGHRVRSEVSHDKGKWYFEMRLDENKISQMGDVMLVAGVGNESVLVGGSFNIRRAHVYQTSKVFGVAIDLDNGNIYYRVNGIWKEQPGSNSARTVKLNQRYMMIIDGSSSVFELMRQELITVNLGKHPFKYSLPDGYKPFSEQ